MTSTRDYTTWCYSRPELKGCVKCGKTDSPHRCKGICKRCYWKIKAERNRQRKLTDSAFREKFHKRTAKYIRELRIKNPEYAKKSREACRKYHANHLEKRKKQIHAYYLKTRDRRLILARRYRLGLTEQEILFIFDRDGRKCRHCGKTFSESRLDIHHIDGKGQYVSIKERNNDPNNLMLLCVGCHTFFDKTRRGDSNKYRQLIESVS